MSKFLNVSNHNSENWSTAQIEKAREYGEIIDIPFPEIDPLWSDERLNLAVLEYYDKITSYEDFTVMVQGESIFSFRLVTKLKAAGVRVVAATTKRISEQEISPDGTTVKTSKFIFEAFKEY